jgi:hypothetical protein
MNQYFDNIILDDNTFNWNRSCILHLREKHLFDRTNKFIRSELGNQYPIDNLSTLFGKIPV